MGGVPRLYAQSHDRRCWRLYDLLLDRIETQKNRFHSACRGFIRGALPKRELPVALFRYLASSLNSIAMQRIERL